MWSGRATYKLEQGLWFTTVGNFRKPLQVNFNLPYVRIHIIDFMMLGLLGRFEVFKLEQLHM